MVSPRWRSRETPVSIPRLPTKINILAIHREKQLWENSGVHFRNFSCSVEQKPENNHTEREEQLPFVCMTPSRRPALLSTKRELPSQKEFSSPGKGGWCERLASPAFWGTTQGTCSVSPHLETSKAKCQPCSWNNHGSQCPAPQRSPPALSSYHPVGTPIPGHLLPESLPILPGPASAQDLHWQPAQASAATQVQDARLGPCG